MSDAPAMKRAWFQFHLNTCVVLMVVAGGFLYGNFDALRLIFEDPHISEVGMAYGFPFTVCQVGGFQGTWNLLAAAGNLICFAVVLLVILRGLEGLVRLTKPD